jgi:lipopolysaccharide/colanic/teichoic acid biosynthesis glycosyltransferase
MIRCFDFVFSAIGFILLLPVLLIVLMIVVLLERNSPLFIQSRLGRSWVPSVIRN